MLIPVIKDSFLDIPEEGKKSEEIEEKSWFEADSIHKQKQNHIKSFSLIGKELVTKIQRLKRKS